MNVLIDTNILLDVLLRREPWLADSQQIWQHMRPNYKLGSSL